jgi:hypothetical protein
MACVSILVQDLHYVTVYKSFLYTHKTGLFQRSSVYRNFSICKDYRTTAAQTRAPSWSRIHDPNFRALESSIGAGWCGQCDRSAAKLDGLNTQRPVTLFSD